MENTSTPTDTKAQDRRVVKVIISIYLLLCCFAFGTVYASVYYFNSMANKEESTNATQQVAATNEAATAQVYAMATSISHATQVAEYEIFENFDSRGNFEPNRLSWYTVQKASARWRGSISIHDGMYVWDIAEVKESNSFEWGGYGPQKIVQDFDLSVDVKLAKGTSELLCYAVAFRVSPRSFDSGAYLFYMCDSGVYAVQYYNKVDGSEPIRSWTRSEAIHSGDWNTISINARGENVVLSINNIVVSEFTDTHVAGGHVYLLVHMFDDQPGTVLFDNFAFQPR